MRLVYKTDHFPHEIREKKIETEIKRVAKQDRVKGFQFAMLKYGQNATVVKCLMEDKGELFRVGDHGHLRFRANDPAIDHDQTHITESWIAPDGTVYPTYYQGHTGRAYSIQEEGTIPSDVSNPETWMTDHQWIKLVEARLYLRCSQEVTPQQITALKEIIQLGHALYFAGLKDIAYTSDSIAAFETEIAEHNEEYRQSCRANVEDPLPSRTGFRDGD